MASSGTRSARVQAIKAINEQSKLEADNQPAEALKGIDYGVHCYPSVSGERLVPCKARLFKDTKARNKNFIELAQADCF